MIRVPAFLKSPAFVLALALAPVAVPLRAQQPEAPVAQLASHAGPRVRTELRPVAPTFADAREPAMYHKKSTTITMSTLVLVLVIVILVLILI